MLIRFGQPNVEKLKAKGDIRSLVGCLGYKRNLDTQRKALAALTEIGTAQAIILELPKCLDKDASESLRTILSRIDPQWRDSEYAKEVISELVDRLGDRKRSQTAEETLVDMGQAVAQDLLTALECPSKRVGAIRVLGRIRCERAVGHLLLLLVVKDDETRAAVEEALVQIGQYAAEPLREMLNSANAFARFEAVRVLGKLSDSRVASHLVSMLSDSEILVRIEAAKALGGIGDESAVDALCAVLEDKSIHTKVDTDELIETLYAVGELKATGGQLGSIVHSPTFVGVMRSTLRQTVLEALGKVGSAHATGRIVSSLGDEEMLVRCAAAEALAKIGDKEAVGPLILALADDIWDVCKSMIEALDTIDPGWPTGEPAKKMVPIITQKLNSDDGWVRVTAASVLGRIGDERAIRPLIDMLNDTFRDGLGNYAVRNASAQALKDLSGHDFGQDYGSWLNWSEKQNI